MPSRSDPVLVVDDHPLYRDALVAVLQQLDAGEVLLAETAEAGLRILRAWQPLRLVLLDLGLPGISGIEAILSYRAARPDVPVVVVSASEDRREVDAVLQAGALAFISKGAHRDDLRASLAEGLAGGPVTETWVRMRGAALPRQIAAIEAPRGTVLSVTPRQLDTLTLLAQGHSNKEIALRLGLAEITVKVHVSALFRLLSVVNRTQAVLAARRLGLLEGTRPVPVTSVGRDEAGASE